MLEFVFSIYFCMLCVNLESNLACTILFAPSISLLRVLKQDRMAETKNWTPQAVISTAGEETVQDVIRDQALAHPDAPAVCFGKIMYSYHQLDAISSCLATYMGTRNSISSDDIIPILCEKVSTDISRL